MDNVSVVQKAMEYQTSEIGLENKANIDEAWRKYREFIKLYPFRSNPASIDALTPDMVFNPGKDYFLTWIEHKLIALGHMGIGSALYAINAKKDISKFKELLHLVVNDSLDIWQKIDPWDTIKFWGGDRQVAKKILFCYYPENILPILSQTHLINFAQTFSLDIRTQAEIDFNQDFMKLSVGKQFQIMNKLLIDFKKRTDVIKNWDNPFFMSFLYQTIPQFKSNLNYSTKSSSLSHHEKSVLLNKFKNDNVSEKEILEAFQNNSANSIVLKALNKVGIKNIPDYENDVIALFSKLHVELGFPMIVEVQTLFPDVIAEDLNGKETKIELELLASNFDHDPKGCDYIVCWENDLDEETLKNLPKVISLKSYLLEKLI